MEWNWSDRRFDLILQMRKKKNLLTKVISFICFFQLSYWLATSQRRCYFDWIEWSENGRIKMKVAILKIKIKIKLKTIDNSGDFWILEFWSYIWVNGAASNLKFLIFNCSVRSNLLFIGQWVQFFQYVRKEIGFLTPSRVEIRETNIFLILKLLKIFFLNTLTLHWI